MAEIHLMNPMLRASGGSEWRTVELFKRLAERAEVTIWCGDQPDPTLAGLVPMRRLSPRLQAVPRRGTMIVVGTYLSLDPWIAASHADRFILIHNYDAPDRLTRALHRLDELGHKRVEVVYTSAAIRDRTDGPPGEIHFSPIDLARFHPSPRPDRPFTIGKMTRDDRLKHHPDDPAFYRRLADEGVHVRLMGGEVLQEAIGAHPNVEMLPAGSMPAENFLASLDVFVYRTHPDWFEPFGRVVAEAMASGVPIVAESRHGYADCFAGGFLVDAEAQMESVIRRLRDDADLRNRLAHEGRAAAESHFGEAEVEKALEFYLRP